MRIFLAVLVLSVVMCGAAVADELRFTWDAYTGDGTQFLIKQDLDDNIFATVDDVSITSVQVPAPEDLDCHNYWIVAVRDGVESLRNDGEIMTECPGQGPPPIATQRPLIIRGFGVERIIIE